MLLNMKINCNYNYIKIVLLIQFEKWVFLDYCFYSLIIEYIDNFVDTIDYINNYSFDEIYCCCYDFNYNFENYCYKLVVLLVWIL